MRWILNTIYHQFTTNSLPAIHPQAWLETVVPKAAHAPIMVVAAGRLAGRRGRLLEANIKAGMAAVQLVGDGAVERLPLDDIAEYVGAPEEEDDY